MRETGRSVPGRYLYVLIVAVLLEKLIAVSFLVALDQVLQLLQRGRTLFSRHERFARQSVERATEHKHCHLPT